MLGSSGQQVWVTRITDGSDVIWVNTYGENEEFPYPWTTIETENSEFLMGMQHGDEFSALLIDGDGEIIWQNNYGEGICHALIELKRGKFLMLGHRTGQAYHLGHLMMIDCEGEVIWRNSYDADEFADLYYMSETEGGVLLFGNTGGYVTANPWLIKVDFDTSFALNAGTDTSFSISFIPQTDTSYSAIMTIVSGDNELEVELSGIGLIPNDVDEDENIPLEYALHNAFPNPFNSKTNILYDLKAESIVSLTIYDLGGREVANLVNQSQAAGRYSTVWNAEGVPSGMYLLSFKAVGTVTFEMNHKVILMK